MRVLITWATKRGGTEGIAQQLASVLQRDGLEVVLIPATKVRDLKPYDAVIVGGALYANRWHRAARCFVDRNAAALRTLPVWFFSSGPLDDSADRTIIAPVPEVAVLMERVGALGHATFGGRLSEDAKGFPASVMAKKHHGDFRDRTRITAWAKELADALPRARPGVAVDHHGHALWRWAFYAALGWALCAATLFALQHTMSMTAALALHALAAPAIFAPLAQRYFRARGARAPLTTALALSALVALLDLTVVTQGLLHSLVMLTSFVGTWLPLALIFAVTWITGTVMAMRPTPKPPTRTAAAPDAGSMSRTEPAQRLHSH